MRYRKTFQFFDTEAQAAQFCESMNSGNAYLRRKHPAHYTPWISRDGSEHKYVAWYYTR